MHCGKGRPAIERLGEETLDIRRRSKGRPRQEPLGLNYAVLSDPRLGGPEYRWMERTREELTEWRTYYLDPRVAMRAAQPPSDVRDIGVHGEHIAPFPYKLKAEHGKHFAAVLRTLRSMVPSIETLDVSLDRRQGTLDLLVRQDGIDYSSRIVSEGTLRVLGLCAIAVNPWGGSLLAFEEPENGVHPRRLELIAQLLLSLALDQGRQVIVQTKGRTMKVRPANHEKPSSRAPGESSRRFSPPVFFPSIRRDRSGRGSSPCPRR